MGWRSCGAFLFRTTVTHTVTYYVAGISSFLLILGRYVVGEDALTWYFRDQSDFALWVLPAQILRGVLIGLALYPFRQRFHELRGMGGFAIAGIYLLVGQFACPGTSPGSIEGFVYTRLPLDFQLAVIPEIVVQGLALGFLLQWWDGSAHAREVHGAEE